MTQVRFTRKGIVVLFFVLLVLGGIAAYVIIKTNQANEASNAAACEKPWRCSTDLTCDAGCEVETDSSGAAISDCRANGFGDIGHQRCKVSTVSGGDGNGICEVSDCTYSCNNGGVTNLQCNSDCHNPRARSKDVCRGGGGGTCQLCEGINGNKCGPTGPNDDVSCTKSCECFPTGDPGLKTCYEEGPPYSDGTLNCRRTQQDIIADRNPDGTIPWLGACFTDGADWDTCFPEGNPLCRSLVVRGGTGTGQNRVVDEFEEMVFTATGYDPDGAPANISICYTIAGQPTSFYSTTTPVNPWVCQTSTSLIPVTTATGTDYSFTIRSREQQLNFANMRAAIVAKLTQFTAAQVNASGITFATNIADNTSASIFCSTNPGYNNGAGVLINNGQNAGTCDGDTCVAKLTLAPVVTNKPACRSLTLTGGTVSGASRIVTLTEAITATVVGADPDGAPAKIGICYALAGQPTSFYQSAVAITNPANPWTCIESTNLVSVSNGYSATFTGLTYTAMRTAIMAKTPAHTAAQVDAVGVQIITRIYDNSDGTECSTNIGYNNGAGIIWPGGTQTCDGDSCLARISVQAVPQPKTCFQTGCIAAGGCTGTGVTCDQTLDKCINVACPTDADCVCSEVAASWNVTKSPVVSCVDDRMQTSTARVTYNLDVQYITSGSANGTLDTVVDRPVGIRMEWVDANAFNPAGAVVTQSTTNPGFVDNITWTLTGALASFTPNQTKRFTYVVAIPAGVDGVNYKTYANVVSIYGTSSIPLDTATANTPVSCIPFTGLFDEVWVRIAVGFMLLAGGVAYVSYSGTNNVLGRAYMHTQAMLFKDAQVRLSQVNLEEKVLSKKAGMKAESKVEAKAGKKKKRA